MALGHWLKDYIGPHSGGSGGGGAEPLIICVTEEEVKDPQTQRTIGFKTDTLASDAYEAWQNGRPVYYNINGDKWAVSSVTENNVVTIYWPEGEVAKDSLTTPPFADGYLVTYAVDAMSE